MSENYDENKETRYFKNELLNDCAVMLERLMKYFVNF